MAQRWSQIQTLLHTTRAEARWQAVILTDGEGLPMVSVAESTTDADTTAALAALAQRVAARLESRIGMDTIDESQFRDEQGRRLVCRPFRAASQELILVVVLGRNLPYRRATTGLIREVQRLWRTV